MKLIKNFALVPFGRLLWFNLPAKREWDPVIKKLNVKIQELEMLSVVKNQRPCGTVTLDPHDILDYEKKYPELIFKPIRNVKKFQGFAHKHETAGPKDPFYSHYVASKSLISATMFKDAYWSGDHHTQGRLLDFPECCRNFFYETWSKGYIDPTAQMAGKDNPHPWCNPLLRYIGVRVSFHLPCSFNCKPTIELAEKRLSLLENEDQKILIKALLSMPMEWDCWHGAVQIKTPIFWCISHSTPCEDRHVIKIKGDFIPKEAKHG